jgi:hypothetical protein
MSEMTLFSKTNSAVAALLKQVEDSVTDRLSGGSTSSNRRISIEGGVFREFVGGKEVRKSEDRALKIVIVNAAPVSRMFFEGTYVKGQKTKPTCWSSDTQRPDTAVPDDTKQATYCKDCPQHVKGSGQGDSRACRFQQRIAVVLASDTDIDNKVYQVTLPSTSVFGDADGQKMPLQAYGRHLKAHGMPSIGLVTEMRFDTDSATPKLVFKPVRPLEEEEVRAVLELQNHEDTIRAITLNVSQMDGVISTPKLEGPKPDLFGAAPKAKKAEAKAEEDEPVEEPKKVVKKTAAAEVTEKASLSDIVGDWDDC